eukprot:2041703-Heterocapsa_arctica.AAC.1
MVRGSFQKIVPALVAGELRSSLEKAAQLHVKLHRGEIGRMPRRDLEHWVQNTPSIGNIGWRHACIGNSDHSNKKCPPASPSRCFKRVALLD